MMLMVVCLSFETPTLFDASVLGLLALATSQQPPCIRFVALSRVSLCHVYGCTPAERTSCVAQMCVCVEYRPRVLSMVHVMGTLWRLSHNLRRLGSRTTVFLLRPVGWERSAGLWLTTQSCALPYLRS